MILSLILGKYLVRFDLYERMSNEDVFKTNLNWDEEYDMKMTSSRPI